MWNPKIIKLKKIFLTHLHSVVFEDSQNFPGVTEVQLSGGNFKKSSISKCCPEAELELLLLEFLQFNLSKRKKGYKNWISVSRKKNPHLHGKIQNYQWLKKCQFKPEWDFTTYLPVWLQSKTQIISNVGRKIKKLKLSYITNRNAKFYSHFRKYSGTSSKSKN